MPTLPASFTNSLLNYSPISLASKPATGKGGTVATPSLTGAKTQSGSGPYGTVPTVPDPLATQATALQGNLSQMDQIQAIMEQLNQQSAQNAQLPLTMNLPNYQNQLGQAMGNITQLQQGLVPTDVWSMMQQGAAERGIGMGSPTSPNANAALMRVLGQTSTGNQQQGLANLIALMGAIPRAPLADPSSLMLAPGAVQEAQYLANVLKAAPSPEEAAQAELEAINRGLNTGQGAGGYTIGPGPSGGAPSANINQPANWGAAPKWYGMSGPSYGTTPSLAGPSFGTTAPRTSYGMGSLYSPGAYGLPSWQDTMSQIGGDAYTPGYAWGNQPVSSGQMYVSPKDQWTQAIPTGSYPSMTAAGYEQYSAPTGFQPDYYDNAMSDFEAATGIPESEAEAWGYY